MHDVHLLCAYMFHSRTFGNLSFFVISKVFAHPSCCLQLSLRNERLWSFGKDLWLAGFVGLLAGTCGLLWAIHLGPSGIPYYRLSDYFAFYALGFLQSPILDMSWCIGVTVCAALFVRMLGSCRRFRHSALQLRPLQVAGSWALLRVALRVAAGALSAYDVAPVLVATLCFCKAISRVHPQAV
jgi:hypothetical protein